MPAMFKYSIFFTSLFFLSIFSSFRGDTQILKPVKWAYTYERVRANEGYIVIKAQIDKGWHIYAQDIDHGDGPIPTSFKFDKDPLYSIIGKTNPIQKPKVLFDPTFKKNIGFHENLVVFKQRIHFQSSLKEIKGSLEFMVCNDKQCLPPQDLDFAVSLQ